MKVKDCMSHEVYFVTEETPIKVVAKIMADNHIGSIPVCTDKKELLGFVTDRDIVLRAVSNGLDINTTTVSDIMSTKILRTTPDSSIEDAQEVMSTNQIRRLPVMENNKVVGILTMGDLAQNDEIGSHTVGQVVENICDCEGKTKNCQ
ncbi:MAG: CBS domain-containing protein [Clostridia bacterium]|nr:CBS domain-containing protein [Clostridia bacterium]